MKPKLFAWFLFFLLAAAASQLPAQQGEADRKLLADIRAKAEKGDAQSQDELGRVLYAGGLGVAPDEAEAVKWFRKAAQQGLAQGQYNLGCCYAKGGGVAKDEVEAAKWCRKAAEQGLAAAQYNLGCCYTEGEGVARDDVEAAKWFRKSAEQGEAGGQCNLGVCYKTGRGVAKDEVEAAKWYRKAAQQGLAEGQSNLGYCYEKGQGMAKDEVEAVKWFRKAAEQGEVGGQYALGLCYSRGEGVAKDYVEGYKWCLLAAAQGNDYAKQAVPTLESLMTREQIAEGQKLARNFKPREAPPARGSASGLAIGQMRPESSGTGFFITQDGYLITNQHVAGNGAQVRLVTEAGLISAKVVRVDLGNDLALLKAEGRSAPLPVSASRAVKLGNTVATVGFPNSGLQGFAPKLAKGEIASLSGAQDDPRYFQISVPLQPGNSGGALVDERGNVVGVVSAKLNAAAALATSGSLPENVNYAIKSSLLLSFLESVPEVAAKLKEPSMKERKLEDVAASVGKATVLVLVY